MTCFSAAEIYRYLDGELDASARAEFERHLGLCPACRRALDERRRLNEAAAALPPLEPPPDFTARVMARLEDRPRVSVFGWLALASTAVVSVLAVTVGLLVLSGHSLGELVLGLEGFLIRTLKSGTVLFGQVTSFVTLTLSLVRHFLSALWEGLSGLASVLPLPELALALGVTLLIVIGSIVGLRKILVGVRS
jgi:anti-sigma factor RsiW